MSVHLFTNPIQRWAEDASAWLNRWMRDAHFVRGILVEPAEVGVNGERRPQPRVLLAVARPDDASAHLPSILQVHPLPESATVHFVERLPLVVYGNLFQDLFQPNDGAGIVADIERKARIDATVAAGRQAAAAERRRTAEEARVRRETDQAASRDARARARMTRRTEASKWAQDEARERQRIRIEGQNARREARITDATDRVNDRISGRQARLKSRREEVSSNQQGWLDLLLSGRKARSHAWQTALTEGVREAITGRKERQALRTDAHVARRTEAGRRRALMAKAGHGWTPDPSPSGITSSVREAPDVLEEKISGIYGALNLFFEEESYGAEEEPFDPKAMVLRTMEKTKEGTLPPPSTWTRGLTGSALTLGEMLTGWVVEHVVSPVKAGAWDAIVLAGAAASKGKIEDALKRANPEDRAQVSLAIERVLA